MGLFKTLLGLDGSSTPEKTRTVTTTPKLRRGGRRPRPAHPDAWKVKSKAAVFLHGDDGPSVVGESHYQDALDWVAQGKTEGGHKVECLAELAPEPTNPYDKNAVAVLVAGRKVGHLPRETAKEWQPVLRKLKRPMYAHAIVTGGWVREDSEGSYGLRLQMVDAGNDFTATERIPGWVKRGGVMVFQPADGSEPEWQWVGKRVEPIDG